MNKGKTKWKRHLLCEMHPMGVEVAMPLAVSLLYSSAVPSVLDMPPLHHAKRSATQPQLHTPHS